MKSVEHPERAIPLQRLIVGYGAIACAVPYLILKVAWLAGWAGRRG